MKTPTAAEIVGMAKERVEQFVTSLREMGPNELDAVELEGEVQQIVNDLGLSLMRGVFRRADEAAPEVVVRGETWGARRVTKGTYTVKFGTFALDRSTYQQSGKGRVLVPMELRLGVVEGRYSPALARVMAHVIAEMPAEHGEAMLKEVGLAMVSRSTLGRVTKDMASVYERDRGIVEAAIRAESRVPASATTVQAALDGVMVAMDGELSLPRGRKSETPASPRHERHHPLERRPSPADDDQTRGAAYHEASAGTLTFYDAECNALSTITLGRMPEHRKETLADQLGAELKAALQERPDLQVALASDGAPTQWEHLTKLQSELPAGVRCVQLLDFCHGAKYLFDAAKLVEPDEGKARAQAEGLRARLRHRKDGAEVVLRSLRHERDSCANAKTQEKLDTIYAFFSAHRNAGRLAYKQAVSSGFPIGTGSTEAAAKTAVNVRMKRAGARYDSHGGQTILTFRCAVLSERFDLTMREILQRYTTEVRAA